MTTPEKIPLSPAQRSRIRRLSASKEPDAGEEAGELNIIPYLDIIMNIVVFVVSSLSVVFVSTIDSTPPSIGGAGSTRGIKSEALNLVVLITSEGVSLKTSSGNIATGCNSLGAGIAVPKTGGQHDFAELTRCASELKKKNERAESETQVTITANPDVDFQTVIEAIDAVREVPGDDNVRKLLFPDVAFGVAR
ncbi:MAG: biopolymer transporter ExbD [Myxococcales bacterium]|nr:biopolymer transporter ExbD [Myxococcales bacterium]